MFRDFWEKLDQKYVKICTYAAVTVLITAVVGAIVFSTGPFWTKLWMIFTAVLRPIIIGGIISYLLMIVYSLCYLGVMIKTIKQRDDVTNRNTLFIGLFLCIGIQMFLEPVMTGESIFLIVSVIIGSMIESMLENE